MFHGRCFRPPFRRPSPLLLLRCTKESLTTTVKEEGWCLGREREQGEFLRNGCGSKLPGRSRPNNLKFYVSL